MSLVNLVPVGDAARRTMAPSEYVPPTALRSGAPREQAVEQATSPDGKFTIGVWSAEPYSEWVSSHPGFEYTFLFEGSVTLTSEDGTRHSFTAGEAFTIGPGWSGEYRVEEPLLKHYVFYEEDFGSPSDLPAEKK